MRAWILLLAFGSVTPAWADCASDRDCGEGVACRSGKCATSPDSSCASDRDCGGASCRSGKCANAPDGNCASDRDCGKGSCRSGKCAVAAGECASDRDCGKGVSCQRQMRHVTRRE